MSKNISKKTITVLATVIILGFLILYLIKNPSVFEHLKKIDPKYSIPIAISTLIFLYINGLFLKKLTQPFGVNLKKHFLLSLTSSFLNQITPFKGGAFYRAIYMKRNYKLNYSHFLSSFLGTYVIIFLANSIIGLIVLSAIFIKSGTFNIYIFGIFGITLIGTLISTIFHPKIKEKNFITHYFKKIITGWEIITKHKIVLHLVLLSIIGIIIQTIINMFAFNAIGVSTTILQALFLAVVKSLSIVISITPGGIGITEGLYLVTASSANISPQESLAAALVIRGVNIITILVFGGISTILLQKTTPPSLEKKSSEQ